MHQLTANLFYNVLAVLLCSVMFMHDSRAQTPTVQDCLGAIPICSDSITISFNHNGMGNYTNEIANVSSCYAPEQRSVWFKFTIQSGGLLRFEINPANGNQDHDWTLFDLTTGTCSQLSTSTGASSAMVRSNTWGAWGFNGPTGVSTPNGGTGTCNGPGTFNGPKWCSDLSVSTGETYYLHITNWTGSVYGFTIDFSSSTATLFDNQPPQMDSIASQVNCQAFDSMIVEFDEGIKCSNIQAGDFQLSGPAGLHTITSASGISCAGGFTDQVVVHFSPAVTQIGDYELTVQPGAGYLEDACGNLDTLDTMSFYFDGAIYTTLTPDHLECFQECDGGVTLNVAGGSPPLTYSWNNSTTTMPSQTGLCAGTYVVSVEDQAGCLIVDSVEVEQPDDITTSLVSKSTTSCPGTSNCDAEAEVTSTGGVGPYTYAWSSGETGATPSSLCEGVNSVTITDANGCLDTFEVEIESPTPIVTTGDGDTLICISNVTNVAASATGGTPPYNYIWHEHDLSGTVISTSQVTPVAPDSTTDYVVQVIDDRGCVGDTSLVTIQVRPPLGLHYTTPDTICPYDTIDLVVEGTGGDSTYTYAWGAGGFGSTLTVSPDASRYFDVTVNDGCGTPAFTDSIFVQVGGYSPIDVTIRAEDDSICKGESVYLIASGRGGFRGPDEFEYTWSHTSDRNPIQFVRPGSTKTYSVTITDLCLSEPGASDMTIAVGSLEYPDLEATPNKTCGGGDVTITNTNFTPGSTYEWRFDDGAVYVLRTMDSLSRQFETPGCYDVTMQIETVFGCVSETTVPCVVQILDQPSAGFSFDPEELTNINPFATVVNRSIGDVERTWFIGNDTIEDVESIYRFFDEHGSDSLITLAVVSEDGCKDTVVQRIPFEMKTLVYYPKSFSPNGDGTNDAFGVEGEAIGSEDFLLEIYDRWGKPLHSAKDPQKKWDGKLGNGAYVPQGVYPFILQYRDHFGELRVIRDQVIVSKSGKQTGLQ